VTPLALYAQPAYLGPNGVFAAPAGPQRSPETILRQAIDRLTGFFYHAAPLSMNEVNSLLEREIAPHFDFDYLALWVGGSVYRDMNDAQRARFSAHLRKRFLSALGRNLGAYSRPPPRIEVYRARPGNSVHEVIVSVRVQPINDYPLRLGFCFYLSAQGWKIFDVIANGFSAAAHYREYYRTLMGPHGPESLVM
jgi:phospholipid transport system substrate-binding protein